MTLMYCIANVQWGLVHTIMYTTSMHGTQWRHVKTQYVHLSAVCSVWTDHSLRQVWVPARVQTVSPTCCSGIEQEIRFLQTRQSCHFNQGLSSPLHSFREACTFEDGTKPAHEIFVPLSLAFSSKPTKVLNSLHRFIRVLTVRTHLVWMFLKTFLKTIFRPLSSLNMWGMGVIWLVLQLNDASIIMDH